MRETKASRSAILLVIAVVLAAAVVVAGCGGGGSSSVGSTAAAEEEGMESDVHHFETTTEDAESEEHSGEVAPSAAGKAIFTANCASCHTLKDAGATGEVGPDLDQLRPETGLVEHQVEDGGGGMPAFGKEGTLTDKEIQTVATYVAAAAEQG